MSLVVVVTLALFSLSAAGAGAAAIPDESQARIVDYDSKSDPDGSYSFSYETSNGIFRSESGYLANVGQEDEYLSISGSYSYTDPDGKIIRVLYSADKNGFHVEEPQTAFVQSSPGVSPQLVASLLGK